MSPSSSGSWDGAGADIIDLDRYMRGNVRPSRTLSEERQQCEQLVVDAGGIGRKLVDSGARHKRHSHDSGVSDTSYDQRRAHNSRRGNNSDSRMGAPREQTSARTFNGHASDSLRAFRTVCEQAILDQQKQIAQVAQLCERLTERANERLTNTKDIERPSRKDVTERPSERLTPAVYQKSSQKIWSERSDAKLIRPKLVKNTEQVLSETSDISSSSRSTRDLRRKEKHRTQECKTYKIIMTKLDELNRRFSPARGVRRPAPRCTPSDSSVSVCDKLVATEPERTVDKVIRPFAQLQRIQFQGSPKAPTPTVTSEAHSSRLRVIAQAYSVDIAPRDVTAKSPNVAVESVNKCSSSLDSGTSAVGDPRCKFDLEDPVHLYSQAKRLQALTATTRRGRSQSSADTRSRAQLDAQLDAHAHCVARASKTRSRSPSLCALCRGYWRSLRQCLVAPFSQDCKCS